MSNFTIQQSHTLYPAKQFYSLFWDTKLFGVSTQKETLEKIQKAIQEKNILLLNASAIDMRKAALELTAKNVLLYEGNMPDDAATCKLIVSQMLLAAYNLQDLYVNTIDNLEAD